MPALGEAVVAGLGGGGVADLGHKDCGLTSVSMVRIWSDFGKSSGGRAHARPENFPTANVGRFTDHFVVHLQIIEFAHRSIT
jgi:hypothetical protein